MGKGKGLGLFDGTHGSGVDVNGQRFTIHQGHQDKHIWGTNNHARELRKGEIRSVLTGNPHELLREWAGRGVRHTNKEVVDTGNTVGRFFCTTQRQFFDTTRITIHYDSKGQAHIVPARPGWMLP